MGKFGKIRFWNKNVYFFLFYLLLLIFWGSNSVWGICLICLYVVHCTALHCTALSLSLSLISTPDALPNKIWREPNLRRMIWLKSRVYEIMQLYRTFKKKSWMSSKHSLYLSPLFKDIHPSAMFDNSFFQK